MHNTKDEPFHQTASLPKIFSLILYFTRKQVGEMNWFSRKLKKVTEEFRKRSNKGGQENGYYSA